MTHRYTLNPLTCTDPHPDHFDPTKFGPNGEPLVRPNGVPVGRPGRKRIVPRDVEAEIFALMADMPRNQRRIDALFDGCGAPASREWRRQRLGRIRLDFSK